MNMLQFLWSLKKYLLWSHIFFIYYSLYPAIQQNSKMTSLCYLYSSSFSALLAGIYWVEIALSRLQPLPFLSQRLMATHRSLTYCGSQNIWYSWSCLLLGILFILFWHSIHLVMYFPKLVCKWFPCTDYHYAALYTDSCFANCKKC